jgi:3'-phosphoadenosine 5'-phosphosulfate sulfotransferase (PAPS reductase)/FAD synthetase
MDAPQCELFEAPTLAMTAPTAPLATVPSLQDYDRFVVFFSGGKDSVACFLHLLDRGVPREKIELHHHLVDGRESAPLMDWPVTESYCAKFAQAFGVPIFFSWKEGGFEREMLRQAAPTAPIKWINAVGNASQKGGEGPLGVRRRFPQVSADLSVRWCSSYLKIDVGCRVLTNEPRFQTGKTLVLTGERAEESSARAKYKTFEPHRSDNRHGKLTPRFVDHWRPVHQWTETKVWEVIERYRVNPHPAYHLGWGRTSCAMCIFGSAKQFASASVVLPQQFERVVAYEREFGVTIKRNATIQSLVSAQETVYVMSAHWVAVARSTEFNEPIVVKHWTLPQGAFGDSSGPT